VRLAVFFFSSGIVRPLSAVFTIVAPREIFFEPDVEADEEVAAAHFFDLEFGDPVAAVAPGDRDGGEAVSAHDGLKGELDCDVEMRGKDGPDAVNNGFPVGFEGVRCVVKAVVKEDANKGVREAVQEELHAGIVNRSPALDETAPEHTVESLVELFPIPDDVPAVVGFVGHHDDDRIACHGIQTADERPSQAVRTRVPDRFEMGEFFLFLLQDRPGAVGRAVIHDNDFMGNPAQFKFQVQVLESRCDAALLVPRRDDDRKKLQAFLAWDIG